MEKLVRYCMTSWVLVKKCVNHINKPWICFPSEVHETRETCLLIQFMRRCAPLSVTYSLSFRRVFIHRSSLTLSQEIHDETDYPANYLCFRYKSKMMFKIIKTHTTDSSLLCFSFYIDALTKIFSLNQYIPYVTLCSRAVLSKHPQWLSLINKDIRLKVIAFAWIALIMQRDESLKGRSAV